MRGAVGPILPDAIFAGLAHCVFFLLFRFPFFADLFEFFWGSFTAMSLHGHVGVEVVQCAVRLFTAVPATLVHSLDFLIAPSWPLVLRSTGYWHKGVDGIHGVARVSHVLVHHPRMVGLCAYWHLLRP